MHLTLQISICPFPNAYLISPLFVSSDVDECASSNGGCDQICTNNPGSYQCSCNQGYISSGKRCQGTFYSYSGYTYCAEKMTSHTLLSPLFVSLDVNECASSNGGCDQICTNNPGSYQCSCNQGYISSGKRCQGTFYSYSGYTYCAEKMTSHSLLSPLFVSLDVNECASSNGGCDQICTNKPGTYQCSCNQGYISSGKRCQGTFYSYSGYTYCAEKMTSHSLLSPLFVSLDVNECASSNGGCDQICTNKPGTYQCSCNQGYISSGKRCQGTFYSYSGYTYCAEKMTSRSLLSPLFVSLDVNECASSNGGCDQICTNKPGTYQCSCNQGYISSGKRCQGTFYSYSGYTYCAEKMTSHSLLSPLFVSLDVNECASSNGGCDQICTNKPGTYQCSCNQGYISSGKRCQGIILKLCLKILSRENEISHLNISALCFFRRWM